MELVFGTKVRSVGRRLGYLAGLEVDPSSRAVTKIVFSEDGKLGPHAHTRPLTAVRVEGGSLLVQDAPGSVAPAQRLLWSRATRAMRGDRETGRLAGVVVGQEGAVEHIVARQGWLKRRQRIAATDLDISVPGEIRQAASGSIAA